MKFLTERLQWAEEDVKKTEELYNKKIRELHIELAETKAKLRQALLQLQQVSMVNAQVPPRSISPRSTSSSLAMPLPAAVPVAVPVADVVPRRKSKKSSSHKHRSSSRHRSSRSRTTSPRHHTYESTAVKSDNVGAAPTANATTADAREQARMEFYSAVSRLKAGKMRDLERRIASAESSLRRQHERQQV